MITDRPRTRLSPRIAGQKGCSQDAPPCKLPGMCNGDLLHAEVDRTHRDCQLVCQDYPGCIYYTYNYDNGFCDLFEDCNRDAIVQ